MVSLVSLGLRSFLLAIHWRIRAICPQQTHKCSLIKGSDEWAAHSCVPITFQFMLPCAISSYLPFAMYHIRSMASAKERWRRREAECDGEGARQSGQGTGEELCSWMSNGVGRERW